MAIMTALCMMMALSASANDNKRPSTPESRQRWEAEMVQYKHDILARELNLKESQMTRFFALYDALDRDRRAQFMKVRDARKAISRKANPTDAELTEAARLERTVASNVSALEMKYFNEYVKVLTPQQLYKLSGAEKKIMRDLRKHVGKSGGSR